MTLTNGYIVTCSKFSTVIYIFVIPYVMLRFL